MIIGISESKLDLSILNSEEDTEGYVIRTNHSKRGGEVAFFIRKWLSYNHKSSFCPNTESIFIDIFFPKSKPILVGVLYRPPEKSGYKEYLEGSLEESNIFNIQKC